MLKVRSVSAGIILSIITCFIYTMYWIVAINDEILMIADEDGTSGKKVLLLTIITLGIYGIFWVCKMAKILERVSESRGIKACTNSGVYVISYLLGVIVTLGLMQVTVNKLINTGVEFA